MTPDNQPDAPLDDATPTVASQLTAVGRSAVAVIGLRGPRARHCLDACFHRAHPREFRPGQIRYGIWRADDTDESDGDGLGDLNVDRNDEVAGESIVVTPIGEDEFEIHAHGGVAAIGKIMQSLVRNGVRRIDADDYERHHHSDLLTREAESVLIRCSTTRNAAIAMNQVRFGLADWLRSWWANPGDLGELQDRTRRIMQFAAVGEHLVDPYRVVLSGPPNVGKSSLINRLVGYGRAITHDAPGTTRDVIACDTVIAGLNVRLSDTAGIRVDGDAIEREGIRRGAIAITQAELVVAVVSPSCLDELPTMRQRILSLAPNVPVLEVLNQADRLDLPPPKAACEPSAASEPKAASELRTASARSAAELPRLRTIAIEIPDASAHDDGIADLTDAIIGRLRPADPEERQAIPINQRQREHLQEVLRCDDLESALACLNRLAGAVS
ncbi:GTPase [Neorhodopirellula pilleata]|uniref:tRNA modification GTPase MnmE n=1 Tax=Neorhodopirellula pilleata TaxID=2714738 RepID=A0A5C6A9R3_9BACT|nr:GTPase [Neorhodopirellula pilleata]TWT96299.1 tRNA modification GTPase MnmE [Neorhodopirellula pilleata]